jgi:hypothetical protein
VNDFGYAIHIVQKTFLFDVTKCDRTPAHDSLCTFVSKYGVSFTINPVPGLEVPLTDWHVWLAHVRELWIDRRMEDHAYYLVHLPQYIMQAIDQCNYRFQTNT